jgi:TorA maturation chaperone TorD
MPLQTQDNQSPTSNPVPGWQSAAIADEQRYRAGAYQLLAALLRGVPEQDVLEQLTQLSAVQGRHDELATAMSLLGLAASDTALQRIDDEYHALFIGLGRGELVPFGSWYLTGFLMEKPLALLRDDLAELGYERNADTHEPEDHVAALCEVMAMLIAEQTDLQVQEKFFQAHLASWVDRFFEDLSQAKSAVFYRAVGRFGRAFMELERHYLTMQV